MSEFRPFCGVISDKKFDPVYLGDGERFFHIFFQIKLQNEHFQQLFVKSRSDHSKGVKLTIENFKNARDKMNNKVLKFTNGDQTALEYSDQNFTKSC